MTANEFAASACATIGIAFLLYFFLVPKVPTYTYLRTETGEVTAVFKSSRHHENSEAKASVILNNGDVVMVELPTRGSVEVGEFIEFDILESEREKLLYRLAQEPVQP